MRATWWVVGGMGLGAGLMYVADPRSGRRRRAVAHDKALHAVHEAEDATCVVARDLAHRTRGFFFETLSRMRREEVDDRTIEARIRSALGRVCSHPHAIQVSVEQGRVRLDGVVLEAEHPRIRSRIARVRGVLEVTDHLQVFKQPGSHPELQGGAVRPGDRPEFLQRNWSPAARFVASLGGVSLLTWGISHRGVSGVASVLIGSLLTLRGITNIELKRLTGVGGGRLAIEVHKDITVHAPVEEVFGFWRAMENFPRFMSHVEEVRTSGEDRSHWRVRGPAGTVFEWEAIVTRLIPHQVLAWKSVEGSTVENAGIIHFEPAHDGSATRLDIRMSYNPPAGALGHAFARLLGADPKKQMDDDLMRLKSLIETGKATGHETVSREQLSPSTPERPGPWPVH
ncbi:SRPBCC family protein [Archangium sp.]|uniref:SRPBCC family protein n=1 Tax=Archangium sp. TaxID=1872627 RepID=UPI002D339F37|nr:SRPBCC family protein [Archangium sp.]HYO55155.1 SRPBCC family protein [Archangium sp.]